MINFVLIATRKLFFLSLMMALVLTNNLMARTPSGSMEEAIKPLKIKNVRAAVPINNELATLYTVKNKLYFKMGKKVTLVHTGLLSENTWLYKNKANKIFAFWWIKTKEGKKLFLKTSSDGGASFPGKPAVIAERGIVPAVFFASQQDKVAVTYLSERFAGYQLYFNRSLDGGKTWFKKDVKLNALYNKEGPVSQVGVPLKKLAGGSHVTDPYIGYFGDKLIAVWQELSIFKGKDFLRVVSKTSDDDGATWSSENEILRISNVRPQEMKVDRVDNKLFISLYLPKQGLLTMLSDASLEKWSQPAIVPRTEKAKEVSYMDFAFSDDKTILLSFTSRANKFKTQAHLFKSSLIADEIAGELMNNGLKWHDISASVGLANVSFKEVKPMAVQTKTTLPVISKFKNKIIFAWEDYRGLLPTVLINYSSDGGKTWLKEPSVLTVPGKSISEMPAIVSDENKAWLLFIYRDTTKRASNQHFYVAQLFEDGDSEKGDTYLAKPYSSFSLNLSKEEKTKRLKQRSKEFWAYRVKKEHGKAYTFYDPLYRVQHSEQMFILAQGKIQYMEASDADTDIEIDGNIGFVKTKIKFTLELIHNSALKNGKTTPRTRDLRARWGWFYDNWYLMPYTLFDNRFKF